MSIATNLRECHKPQSCHKYCISLSLICDMPNMMHAVLEINISAHQQTYFSVKECGS